MDRSLLQGWTASLALHAAAVLGATVLVNQLRLSPQPESFRWEVAVVQPTATAPTSGTAPAAPATLAPRRSPPAPDRAPASTPAHTTASKAVTKTAEPPPVTPPALAPVTPVMAPAPLPPVEAAPQPAITRPPLQPIQHTTVPPVPESVPMPVPTPASTSQEPVQQVPLTTPPIATPTAPSPSHGEPAIAAIELPPQFTEQTPTPAMTVPVGAPLEASQPPSEPSPPPTSPLGGETREPSAQARSTERAEPPPVVASLPPGRAAGTEAGSIASAKRDYSWLAQELNHRIEQMIRYPAEARLNHAEGTVIVKIVINDTGEIESLKIVQSSGYALLDEEALALLRRISPLKLREPLGKASVALKQPIRYSLR